MDKDSATLSRKTLGRAASLCDLYDVRRDEFCGISLLKSAPPEATVTSQDVPDIFSGYTSEHTYHDKFHKLSVEAELKVSVLGGLCSLSGSGKYLDDETSSEKVVRGTLIYRITTKEDRINLLHEDLSPLVLTKQLLNSEATHVVSKIRWGANVFLTFERKVHSHSKRKEIAGMLQASLTSIASMNAPSQYLDRNTHGVDNFSIKVQSDVVPDGQPIPQSVEEVTKFMSMIPELVKKFNQGKGKPLQVELYPIKRLAHHFGMAIRQSKLKSDLDQASIRNLESEIDTIVHQKQILNDFVAEVTDSSKYVLQSDLDECIKYQQGVNTADAEFRSAVKEAILAIRQSGASTSILDTAIGNYVSNPHCAHGIPVFMEKKSALKEKMDFFQVMREKDVDFLPKAKSIHNFVTQHDKGDVYVLYHSQQNTEKSRHTILVFIEKIKERNQALERTELAADAAKFLVVDAALHPQAGEGKNSDVRIEQYLNGRLVTKDVVKDQPSAVTQNIISWNRIDKFGSPPRNVAAVSHLMCPLASHSKCKAELRRWVCHKCNRTMLYALEDHFYCNCGGVLIQDCRFKCCDPQHGSQFTAFSSTENLKEQLPKVRDSDCTNILLLGATGVGKTTWINALRNYLEYKTLNDAINGGVKVLISSSFMEGETKIAVGNPDSREASTTANGEGQSSTQFCRSHYIRMGAHNIQLIDTPGIGDVRGLDQDKVNTQHILEYLGNVDQLHGICILLKPNENRLSVHVQFCFTSLLLNLHKHAVNNIMFCYTNARETDFDYGATHALVQKMLSNIARSHDQEVPYNNENTFFFDSKAFRTLACRQHGMKLKPNLIKSSSDCWEDSLDSTFRLLNAIQEVKPHAVVETLSVNDARKLITMLSRPLAEIAHTITSNTTLVQEQIDSIKQFKRTHDQLEACRFQEVEVLKIIPQSFPSVVCTAQKCSTTENGILEYRICHSGVLAAFWTGVMQAGQLLHFGRCDHCKCSHASHEEVYYKTSRVLTMVKDKATEQQIKGKRSEEEIVRSTVQRREEEIRELVDEKKKISEAGARFAVFLKANAIITFNDKMDVYLSEMKLQCEEIGEKDQAEGLEKLRQSHKKHIELYEKFLADPVTSQSSTACRPLKVEDIKPEVDELMKLPRSGPSLREQMETLENCQTRQREHFQAGSTYSKPKLTTSDQNWLRQRCASGLGALWRTFQL